MAAQVALRRRIDDRSLIEHNEDDSRKMGIRAIEKANNDTRFASTGKLSFTLCVVIYIYVY